MTCVLVTGGAGFIGSHLCDVLLQDGKHVICLDNLSSGQRGNIADFQERSHFTFVDGDVREPIRPLLAEHAVAPTSVDQVYHLASRASPADFQAYPVDIALTNSQGMVHVLQFVREANARLVAASTSEVYGDPEVHPQPEAYNGNVNIRGVRSCYDESKRFAEVLIEAFHREYGINARTARIFNTYGPRMRPDDGRVIPTFLTQASRGDDLTVYGDGSQTRSFLFVADLVRGLRALMDTSGLDGAVVNLGSTDEITINELAETVRSLVPTDSGITYEPLPEDDPECRRPDISRAKNLLDWSPETPFQHGLRVTYHDIVDQRESEEQAA